MPYKNYILLKINEFVYITKGNYLSFVSFKSFKEAKDYVDARKYVELFPPETNLYKIITQAILYTIYIHSIYYLFYSKYYIYTSGFYQQKGNERILFLIVIEAFRIICTSIKYIYIYFNKKNSKISYAENCSKKDLLYILIDKNLDVFLLLCVFIIMLFTSNIIFGLLPFVLFLRILIRWQRSLNYKNKCTSNLYK